MLVFFSLCLLMSLCHVLCANGSTPPSSVHSRTFINNCTTSYRERNAYACWSICRQPHNINTGTKNRQDEDFFPCVRGKRFSSIFLRKLVDVWSLMVLFFSPPFVTCAIGRGHPRAGDRCGRTARHAQWCWTGSQGQGRTHVRTCFRAGKMAANSRVLFHPVFPCFAGLAGWLF